MTQNRMDRICFCDPFLFSGLLPTLAAATLAAAVKGAGLEARILYPSVDFFVRHRLYGNQALSQLVDDIPLQLAELFFGEDPDTVFVKKIHHRGIVLSDSDMAEICRLRTTALQAIDSLAEQISRWSPGLFCFSFTFGGYQFAHRLFHSIRQRCPNMVMIAGGSNCTPDFAEKLLSRFSQLDYVLCDETPDTLLLLADALNRQEVPVSPYIASRACAAAAVWRVQDMDALPCPDFDDYFALLEMLRVDRKMVTLPYEIARGCWWAEKKPCTMCGFFGNHSCYSPKSPGKVVAELAALREKYAVNRFRFSDLVQPPKAYLEQLLPLEPMGLKLFWELRPDLRPEDMALLRQIGLTFGQIGMESLSTPALTWMNKGTSVLQNISVLIAAGTYKIDLIWNYLYGAPDETAAWYTEALALIPKLHHLQPPIPRKIWLNRYSELFDSCRELADDAEQCFVDVFPQSDDTPIWESHQQLLHAIAQWRTAYRRETALYLAMDEHFLGVIRGDKWSEEKIALSPDEMGIYLYYGRPHTMAEGIAALEIELERLTAALRRFLDEGIMIAHQEKFLSLATGHSPYKWTRFREQVLYLGPCMFN